jgi:hypothetical protein
MFRPRNIFLATAAFCIGFCIYVGQSSSTQDTLADWFMPVESYPSQDATVREASFENNEESPVSSTGCNHGPVSTCMHCAMQDI